MDRALLLSIAETAIPPGRELDGADERTLSDAIALVSRISPNAVDGWASLALVLDTYCRARHRRSFRALPFGERLDVLESWRDAPLSRHLVRALLAPFKLAHFDTARSYQALTCRHAVETPARLEPARWRNNSIDATTLDDVELECDVVVVGTGAGGGPVAKSLAEQGYGVVLLEEGPFFERTHFSGRPLDMLARMYRQAGMTVTLGNAVIPVAVGKTVGGTTTINAGTSLRAPERVLRSWQQDAGVDFDSAELARYYDEVEQYLGVAPSSASALGKPAVVVARGADALGWSHHALPRNAPGCDGQGLCVFGCPTDAKRSTQVSYVPAALKAGATLYHGVRVRQVLIEDDAAVGVVGVARRADGTSASLRVRARAVVLSCGALHTPALLLKNGLANASGELGRNLSIHPASSAFGLFDEAIDGHLAVPQGYAVDEFTRDGIMFEGATAPPEIMAASMQLVGPSFMSLMERYRQVCGFGFMVKDTSRGRVRVGKNGEPVMTYRLNDHDQRRIQRAMVLLCRLMFAAGAREVFPTLAGFERMRSVDDVERLARASLPARAFDLTAYHPLGTARMGKDPRRSVVGANHEAHDVLNLFVVDGSAVPSSLGVNPQLTIMALATRAGALIGRRLERLAAA